jgi:hypothetical protein
MPSKIAPPEKNSLIKEKSIQISKFPFHFEDDQTDRDRRIRERKKQIK